MIELGKTQALRVLRIKDVGVYLGEPGDVYKRQIICPPAGGGIRRTRRCQ